MNVFRQRSTARITESDLIALNYHELSPGRERHVRHAIASSPSLAADSQAIAASLGAIKDLPMHIDDTVLNRNWKALRPSLLPYPPPPLPHLQVPWWRVPVFAGALMASAATLAFFATTDRVSHSRAHDLSTLIAFSPTPPPSPSILGQVSASQEDLPRPSAQPRTRLHPGSSSGSSPTSRPDSSILLAKLEHPSPASPLSSIQPAVLVSSPLLSLAQIPVSALSANAHPPFAGIPLREPSLASEQGSTNRTGTPRANRAERSSRYHDVNLMLGIGGNFVAPHTSSTVGTGQIAETGSNAVTALAALHQQFRRPLGYRVTASYSRPDFIYSDNTTVVLNSRIYELAGTYVVQGPRPRRFKTAADIGVGLLAFLPTVASQFSGHVYRASGVLGANVDYALTRHWGVRAAYRAQLYKSPNFSSANNLIPVTHSVTVSHEPSLGVVYNFGAR